MVVHEIVAGELRPFHRILSLANPLFRRPSLIVVRTQDFALIPDFRVNGFALIIILEIVHGGSMMRQPGIARYFLSPKL